MSATSGGLYRASVLAIGVAFIGLGLANVEVALVVLAVPPVITNAFVAIDQVDSDVVDAARGMGMNGWEILRKVELPLGGPADIRRDPHGRLVRRLDDHDRRAHRVQR